MDKPLFPTLVPACSMMDRLAEQAGMLHLSGTHAQLGSDSLGCAPSLRLLFNLSSSPSSLSPNVWHKWSMKLMCSPGLRLPNWLLHRSGQRWRVATQWLLRLCSHVQEDKQLFLPQVPWWRHLARWATLSKNAYHKHTKYCLFPYLFLLSL